MLTRFLFLIPVVCLTACTCPSAPTDSFTNHCTVIDGNPLILTASVSYEEISLGGAAFRKPAFEHTLNRDFRPDTTHLPRSGFTQRSDSISNGVEFISEQNNSSDKQTASENDLSPAEKAAGQPQNFYHDR